MGTDRIVDETEGIAEQLPLGANGEPLPYDDNCGKFDIIMEKDTFKYFNTKRKEKVNQKL